MNIKRIFCKSLIAGLLFNLLFSTAVSAQTLQAPVQLSPALSSISPRDQVMRSNDESALLTVKLVDNNGNPIQGHIVKLISSSGSDTIKLYRNTPISDVNGEVIFQTSSRISGLANYTAYDMSADTILEQRAKVVYFVSGADVFQSKSLVKMAAYGDSSGNSSGPADHFEFEEIPAEIKSNQSISLKLAVYDSKKQIVSNYTGKVRFSLDGEGSSFVSLPEDYIFTLQDQGIHIFSLAFTFKQSGSYNLKVTDLDNAGVLGTKSFVVSGAAVYDPESPGLQSGLLISNPVAGTYSANVQVISGTAAAGSRLKIFDNSLEITSLTADATGKFSYTTGLLADGLHKIYVASVNDIGTIISTSPTVDVNIDTQAVQTSNITIEPEGAVDPGTTIKVRIQTGENLSKAQVVVAGNVYNLEKGPEGLYETSFSAPIDFGEYKLNFVLTDDLGNESKSSDRVLKVGGLLLGDKSKPGKVMGLVVKVDFNKVILNWAAPDSLNSAVKNYRIYYGFSPNQLTQAVDTFTNATTWYIPNLKIGTEYYFAVAAVDVKGNVSESFDKIISAVPGSYVKDVKSPEILQGAAGREALNDMKKDASESGPEVFWLLMASVLGGIFYALGRRKGASM